MHRADGYFAGGKFDQAKVEYLNLLRLDPNRFRVAETTAPGRGLALYRTGPKESARLSDWLRDAWARPPRATRPAARR